MIKVLIVTFLLGLAVCIQNPYRRCADNPLYTSNAVASYMFAMPLSYIDKTDTLIYYNIKHYGFKINNPGSGGCSNFFVSNSSCCNQTTIDTLLNYTKSLYESYATITKLPIVSLAKDLSMLLSGSNSSCLNSNGSLNNLKLPGINGYTNSTVPTNIGNAYAQQDTQLNAIMNAQKAIISSQSCLFCLATSDWDKFILSNASLIYSTQYYNSLISSFANSLNLLSNSSSTISSYVTDFISKNVNSSRCSALNSNYTSRISNSSLCTSVQTCTTFANKYFGHTLLPGIIWKMYRVYLNRSDAVQPYEPPAFSSKPQNGFRGNVSYLLS